MSPLVLVHGAGVSPRYFRPLRDALGGDTLAPDLRSAADLALAVAALGAALDDAGIEQADLLGNSFGCQVVTELACERPERVRRIVFVGPTVDRRRRNPVSQARRLALDALREPPRLVRRALRDYLETGPRRTYRMVRSALEHPIERSLPALSAPLLVVRGGRDPLCPQDWAEEVVRLAPQARLAVVPAAAHAVHFSHPEELARLVLPFLEERE